jgi:hypothetical protein
VKSILFLDLQTTVESTTLISDNSSIKCNALIEISNKNPRLVQVELIPTFANSFISSVIGMVAKMSSLDYPEKLPRPEYKMKIVWRQIFAALVFHAIALCALFLKINSVFSILLGKLK